MPAPILVTDGTGTLGRLVVPPRGPERGTWSDFSWSPPST